MNKSINRTARRYDHLRSGNTLVVALGVLVVVVAAITLSSVGATSTLIEVKDGGARLQALAAVEAVLARHERLLLDRADVGTLADFGTTETPLAVDNNYGLDMVGNCSVRWKIEPCRTQDVNDSIPFIINPPPTGMIDNPLARLSSTVHRKVNSVNFLFRISAEATVRPYTDKPPIAIAQGARYAVAMNTPLFRYVIFYAQDGAMGDLEFSHDPSVTIQGNIHSNGAIYIGSGTWVNHWGAAAGPSGDTKLGPDSEGNPITITGVDGIYCLSKPLIFGALNNYPMGGIAPPWYNTWDWPRAYTLIDAPTPLRGATYIINPKGILDAGMMHTNPGTSAGNQRQINDIDIYSGIDSGTDSRDSERILARKWATASPGWFAKNARSSETDGNTISLSLNDKGTDRVDASSRPFEPVKLTIGATPELSSPVQTVNANATHTETPGYYFSQAIGGISTTNLTGDGWTVTPPVPAPAQVGLAIRERPMPDTTLWPGTGNTMLPMSSSDPNFMPYAYGKHWYPTLNPFYPTWVTHGTGSNFANNYAAWGYNNNAGWSDGINVTTSPAAQTYLGSGKLLMSSACLPGNPAVTNIATDDQTYYNNNWQFVHLRKPAPLTTTAGALVAGVNASLFIEDTSLTGSNLPGTSRHRLQGAPAATAVVGTMNWAGTAAINATFGTAAVQNYSMRCEGFVVPEFSRTYTFNAAVTNGVRIWVDGRVVYQQWGPVAAETTPILLTAGNPYPFVVEMFNDTPPVSPAVVLQVRWSCAGLALEVIPATSLFQRTNQSFTKANWTSLEVRLDPNMLVGPSTLKAGIMVRPAGGGLSPYLSGRESYLMLGYSPTRGVFTERRLQPSMVTRSTATAWYTGTGATLDGVAVPATGIMNTVTPHTGPSTMNGVTTNHIITRAAKVTASYTVGAPTYTSSGPSFIPTSSTPVTPRTATVSIDGRPVTITYGFVSADESTPSIDWTVTGKYVATKTAWIHQTVKWTNTNGNANFPTTMNGIANIYGPNNSTTTTTTLPSYGIGNGIYASATSLTSTPQLYSRPRSNTSPLLSASRRHYANSVYSENDPASGHDLAFIVARLNALTWNGRNDWTAAPAPTAPANPPDTSGTVVPATVPNPAVIANPFPGSYTFAIANTALTLDVSVNSWITSSGIWFDPANANWTTPATQTLTNVAKNVPWLTAWTTAGLTPPVTGSFAPNMWVNQGHPAAPALFPTALQSIVGTPRFTDDQPAVLPTSDDRQEIWLQLEKTVVAGRDIVTFNYSLAPAPAAGSTFTPTYVPVTDVSGNPLTADITGWSGDLLMGPCLQSGSMTIPATALFTNLEVGSADPGSISGVFDENVWDVIFPGRNAMSAYLASQYQVFWGANDITQDFFTYQDTVFNGRTATEEGYVNPREFWSQSRWWEDGTEKDRTPTAGPVYSQFATENRQLWARSTFLTLDMGQIQAYLLNTDLTQALNPSITAARLAKTGPSLSQSFNGLIYAARTNRYPWNPTPGSANPFSANPASGLPNTAANTGAASMLTAANMAGASMLHSNIHKLQPYAIGYGPGNDISAAPPFKPQHFHHGVRLLNGAAITWGVTAGDAFGSGKTTIVTPNQLFIQGDLNTVKTAVRVGGASTNTPKNTPLAVVGDQITYLSNAFGPSATITTIAYNTYTTKTTTTTAYGITSVTTAFSGPQVPPPATTTVSTVTVPSPVLPRADTSRLKGFVRYSSALTASNYLPPILLNPTATAVQATTTSYVAAMITNNQPTTAARVLEGQGAPFIDTMQYLEKWGPSSTDVGAATVDIPAATMDYTGSLVVIDSRRYTDAFLLDGPRTAGRNPFGTMGWNALTTWGGNGTASGPLSGSVPSVYSSPDRVLRFNRDLLTDEGTPPFTPNGVTSTGLGGWARIVK
jgi:hypothetical protein